VSTLKSLGYETFECALTPLQFGIPNSRLRYYLLAKKAPLRFPCQERVSNGTLWRCIPGRLDDSQSVDSSEAHVAEVRAYLDYDGEATDLYSIPDRILCKWGRLLDIVLPSSRRTCCFTRGTVSRSTRTLH
jgi:tRNA (cytosine38-C5)-methyltransferase